MIALGEREKAKMISRRFFSIYYLKVRLLPDPAVCVFLDYRHESAKNEIFTSIDPAFIYTLNQNLFLLSSIPHHLCCSNCISRRFWHYCLE